VPATAPASAAPSAAAASAPAAGTLPPYNGIPQSRMPEGFFALGATGAPVTMIDYSDFL
jgi:hypothetical protein